MSVFWWPTADWFVSGATTVTSPIGSSARLSARMPRLSMPSSFVTRIRGRVVQSPSGRPVRLSDRRAPRDPATGSPRSLSRSRRSVLARSRVISGLSLPPGRSSLTAASPLAFTPQGGRRGDRRGRSGARREGPRWHGRRGRSRPRRSHLVHVRVDARDGLPWSPDAPALPSGQPSGGAVGDRAVLAGSAEPVEEEGGQDRGDGDAEDRTRHAGDLRPDDH